MRNFQLQQAAIFDQDLRIFFLRALPLMRWGGRVVAVARVAHHSASSAIRICQWGVGAGWPRRWPAQLVAPSTCHLCCEACHVPENDNNSPTARAAVRAAGLVRASTRGCQHSGCALPRDGRPRALAGRHPCLLRLARGRALARSPAVACGGRPMGSPTAPMAAPTRTPARSGNLWHGN
jgi:hypothetical protein